MQHFIHAADLTCASVNELLPKLTVGQALVYHVGSLMHDRVVGPKFATVHGVATAVYDAFERGEVTLVQRKLKQPFTYEYIAIKRAVDAKAKPKLAMAA